MQRKDLLSDGCANLVEQMADRVLNRTIALRIDHETYRVLDGEAVACGVPLSDLVRHVLRGHAVAMQTWLAGQGDRPEALLPCEEFAARVERRNAERAAVAHG